MKTNTNRFAAILSIGSALMMPIKKMFADSDSEFFPKLSVEWWQWALSQTHVIFRRACSTTILVLILAGAIFTSSALAGGGDVLPPTVTPSGYSLSDMAEATAFFNTGPRTPETYPDTPFQILYYHEKPPGHPDLTFKVSPDTTFYVPVLYLDDTQPVIGHFPNVNDRDSVLNYFYSQHQVGNNYIQIVVDGKVNSLGPDYVVGVGPVKLGDAYDDPLTGTHVPAGTNYIVSAAFLTPLTKGSHTVQIRGKSTGSALKSYQFDGQPVFPNGVWVFDGPVFTVVVAPK